MKPHKHAELIKAWADGAQVQTKKFFISYDTQKPKTFWEDDPQPMWYGGNEYRIKPRKFEDGAFYPVLDVLGEKEVAWHSYGSFYLTGGTKSCSIEALTWIGEKLNIDWPEAE